MDTVFRVFLRQPLPLIGHGGVVVDVYKALLVGVVFDAFVEGDDLGGQWSPVPDPDLKAIRQPTLILNGSQDGEARLSAGRKLCEAIPRATRQELHGAGHLAALDNPAGWVKAVLGFTAPE